MPGLVMVVLAIAVMFLKPPDDFNLQNPLVFIQALLWTRTSASKFLYSLASSLDLFRLWQLVLIGIGLKAAGGKTLSMGGAMTAVSCRGNLDIGCGGAGGRFQLAAAQTHLSGAEKEVRATKRIGRLKPAHRGQWSLGGGGGGVTGTSLG